MASSHLLKDLLRVLLNFVDKRLADMYNPSVMTKEYWQEVEKVARERQEVLRLRLDHLETERAEALQEMAQVEQLLHSVAPFTSDRPLEALEKIVNNYVIDADSGLADACRAVLRATSRYMSASDVRDALEASAYDLTQHSNPLASIHSILKRFEDSGEVSMASIGNKARYRIATEKRSPAWQAEMRKHRREPESRKKS
jgi:hypothetical protein